MLLVEHDQEPTDRIQHLQEQQHSRLPVSGGLGLRIQHLQEQQHSRLPVSGGLGLHGLLLHI